MDDSGKAPLALASALFASLLDAEPWTVFLSTARAAFDASFVTLILTPHAARRPGMLLTPGGDEAVSAEYSDSLFTRDPFTGLPDGVVVRFRDFVGEARRDEDAAFWDFIERTGDEILGVDLHDEGGFEMRLRVSRAKGGSAFGQEDIGRLQAIVPHLRTAGRLFDRLAAGQIERRIYSSAIESMAVGVVILNKTGAILHVNPTAAAILGEADGITRRGERIALTDPAQARLLDKLLRGGGEGEPLFIRIERRAAGGDLCLTAASAEAPAYVSMSGGPATVLYLSDPSQAPRVSTATLRELLGLTAAEAAIAARLADGSALADIAAELGIAHNTARAHLRAIYAKTGVNRQSRLVHLIHHSLAGLSADRM